MSLLTAYTHCRFLTKGAIALLKSTLDKDPAIAAVGPMFLGANNAIQEVGGIVFKDATAANAGRGEPLGTFLYRSRFVDYISAACLMVRNSCFRKVRFFDKIIMP